MRAMHNPTSRRQADLMDISCARSIIICFSTPFRVCWRSPFQFTESFDYASPCIFISTDCLFIHQKKCIQLVRIINLHTNTACCNNGKTG